MNVLLAKLHAAGSLWNQFMDDESYNEYNNSYPLVSTSNSNFFVSNIKIEDIQSSGISIQPSLSANLVVSSSTFMKSKLTNSMIFFSKGNCALFNVKISENQFTKEMEGCLTHIVVNQKSQPSFNLNFLIDCSISQNNLERSSNGLSSCYHIGGNQSFKYSNITNNYNSYESGYELQKTSSSEVKFCQIVQCISAYDIVSHQNGRYAVKFCNILKNVVNSSYSQGVFVSQFNEVETEFYSCSFIENEGPYLFYIFNSGRIEVIGCTLYGLSSVNSDKLDNFSIISPRFCNETFEFITVLSIHSTPTPNEAEKPVDEGLFKKFWRF
ncbi:hypothetical protein TVAG_253150 [Trichomonas vaginalis G3]|uniref:Uncharacterized protein n=1 Tax=Trichomonas vaginalis (strain ATCC PRA-98 / G3) TaxID=412133 RepID=A2EXH4_TRIV3|nr:hypothetical protein TVAGG3_0193570 [Trichomonas vaginalis G3]EAY02664.1 hypothetical protein TVAG_253150 [Trichomonas vaginalis G3]KAI5550149.1 hypothetical protein TVAGG3_0193570 [Trichomonas vaginalis G3]|eukprot:XP_001314887.1 hypothetical protein [Trichomonas vaginalis G3]